MARMEPKEKKYYTIAEVAEMHDMSRQAIHYRVKKFEVPTQLFGKSYVIEKHDLHKLKLS